MSPSACLYAGAHTLGLMLPGCISLCCRLVDFYSVPQSFIATEVLISAVVETGVGETSSLPAISLL